MLMNAAIILISGIIIYFLIYHFRVKYVDRNILKCDPSRATPATVYMDGVEYFPTNKFVLFGFQFKSIAGLAPVGGVIVNHVLPPTDSSSSFIVNRLAEQKHYLELIDKKFGGLVVARIPMFESEIRGMDMLRKVLKSE